MEKSPEWDKVAVRATAPPDEGESGKPRRLTGVNVHLSERERAEEEIRRLSEEIEERARERTAQLAAASEALRESEAKHRVLFESSRDAIMMLAPPSWKFTEANPATLQMFGATTKAEFLAVEPWQVSPERQPEGRASEEKAREMCWHRLNSPRREQPLPRELTWAT